MKLSAYIFWLTLAIFTLSSCEIDTCKGITCENDGTCDNGYCECNGAFHGEFCETENDYYLVPSITEFELYTGAEMYIDIMVKNADDQLTPDVTLSVEELYEELTVDFQGNGDNESIRMLVSANFEADSGTHTFTVLGKSSGGKTKKAVFTCRVIKKELSVEIAGSVLLDEYGEGSETVYVNWVKGDIEAVELSIEGLNNAVDYNIYEPELYFPFGPSDYTGISFTANGLSAGSYPATLKVRSLQTGIEKSVDFQVVMESCINSLEGLYACSHSCNSGNWNYDVDIVGSAQNKRIYISNFYDFGVTVYADVDCEDKTLTIPSQSVGGSTWVGTGYYYNIGGNIYIDFQRYFTQNGTNYVDNCDATLYP